MWRNFFRLGMGLGVLAAALSQPPGLQAAPPANVRPAAVLYSQLTGAVSGITSQNFEAVFESFDSFAADDFTVTLTGAERAWQITTVTVNGYYDDLNTPDTSTLTGARVQIFRALNNLPDASAVMTDQAMAGAQISGASTGDLVITLTSPVVLGGGTYWVSVQADKQDLGTTGRQWLWRQHTATFGSPSAWQNPGGGFAAAACTTAWGTRIGACGIGSEPDLQFAVGGNVLSNIVYLPLATR